jgi:hypothetical protein
MTDVRYYPKINAPFMRDKKGRFTDEWADPLFEEYAHEDWDWFYKWNGTNVGLDVKSHTFFGRTEKTTFTGAQAATLQEWTQRWQDPELEYVYGELVGPGIQGNPHGLDHLEVKEFEGWASGLYPRALGETMFRTSLSEMAAACRDKDFPFVSTKDLYIEGYVGRLLGSSNILTKLKVKDRWV